MTGFLCHVVAYSGHLDAGGHGAWPDRARAELADVLHRRVDERSDPGQVPDLGDSVVVYLAVIHVPMNSSMLLGRAFFLQLECWEELKLMVVVQGQDSERAGSTIGRFWTYAGCLSLALFGGRTRSRMVGPECAALSVLQVRTWCIVKRTYCRCVSCSCPCCGVEEPVTYQVLRLLCLMRLLLLALTWWLVNLTDDQPRPIVTCAAGWSRIKVCLSTARGVCTALGP